MSSRNLVIPILPEKISITGDFPATLDSIFSQDDAPIAHLHLHNCVEIGYCISGSGFFNIENTHFSFSSGDTVLISPNTIHFAQSSTGTKSVWQYAFVDIETLFAKYLPYAFKSGLTDIFQRHFGNLYSTTEYPKINTLIYNIINEMKAKKSYYEMRIVSSILELAILLNRSSTKFVPQFFVETDHLTTAVQQLIPAVLRIQNNYTGEVCIAELAESCHMSLRSFLRHFKKIYNATPYDYVLNLRLSMICKDLKSTDLSINYISDKHGFNSLSSFNRQFKKKYNISPSDWRKANQHT